MASRYAGDVDANVAAAITYCRCVIDEGHMPVASHHLYPQILNDNIPEERELRLLYGLAFLAACVEVWVFGEVSQGFALEIEEKKRLKKLIRYI